MSTVDARPPRRRGRTALLLATAAVLGLVAGIAVGYGVQAERPPTPLPALAQPGLAYPAKALPEGKEPDPLSDKEDRGRRAAGDLRKLLIAKPAGAREANASIFEGGSLPDDGWLTPADYAFEFVSEGSMFEGFVEDDIRRIAAADWGRGQYGQIAVRLAQFRSGAGLGAVDFAESQLDYMPGAERGAGNAGHPIKGSGNGRYFVYPVENKPGYLPVYKARALGYRGDVMFDIHIFDTKPISKKDIRTLAERQLERL
ncbi:hypothetical protein [Streptomyces jeddahensis]|uniref:Uncharacterized protein n=1 Tax=Streptomyces jeddahensis TaxID=1716141 RepID=A0A177HQL5_9ACTN|nr:hypothetical protein [Streptomyces jeddahensis]OAH13302.1 hypothetical protein STSP_33370 [Streptomyces jeddahensis]